VVIVTFQEVSCVTYANFFFSESEDEVIYEPGDIIKTAYPPYGKIKGIVTGFTKTHFIVLFMDGKVRLRTGQDFELYYDIALLDLLSRRDLEDKISSTYIKLQQADLVPEDRNYLISDMSNIMVEHTNRVHRELREIAGLPEETVPTEKEDEDSAPRDFKTRKYLM